MTEWWNSGLSKDIVFMVPEEWGGGDEILDIVIPATGALDNKLLSIGEVSEFDNPTFAHMLGLYQAQFGAGTAPGHNYGFNFGDGLVIGSLAAIAAGDASPEAISAHMVAVANPPGVEVYTYAEGKKLLEEGKQINYQGAASPDDFDEYGNVFGPLSTVGLVDGSWEQIAIYSAAEQDAFANK